MNQKSNSHSRILMFAVSAVFLVLLAFGIFKTMNPQKPDEKVVHEESSSESSSESSQEKPDVIQVSFLDTREQKRQQIQEQKILREYQEKEYTLEDPFIKLNPYGTMPLAALLMFETEKPAKVFVRTEGIDEHTAIEHEYSNYETSHQIPVLGLYPDKENEIIIRVTLENDEEAIEKTLTIETEPLPDDLLEIELVESKPEKMGNGLSFMIPKDRYIYGIDSNADIRWYSIAPVSLAFERLENGNILFATQDEARDQFNKLIEMNMLGKIYKDYIVEIDGYEKENIIHHDVIELPGGNLLATIHEPDSKYIEDQMVEIDRQTGETVHFIDNRSLFPPASYEEYTGKNAEDNDWLHQNAVIFDEDSESLLISGRSQDAILKMSYPDAELEWILAALEEWPKDYEEEYLLKPIGKVDFPAGQHAVKILPDQDENSDTMDILLFDNNTVITRGDKEIGDMYSRAVQYRINEKEKTVEEVWSYGEERGTDFFSDIVGNTQYLEDSNTVLITSGAIRPVPGEAQMMSQVVEVTHEKEPEVVFEAVTPEFKLGDEASFIYRSIRLPLYPDTDWNFHFSKTE